LQLKYFGFDPIGIDEDDLLNLVLEIFLDINVHQQLGIDTAAMQRFLQVAQGRIH
jgi:hypothetical protein